MVSTIYSKQVELCGKMLEVANSTSNCALKDDLYAEVNSILIKVFVYYRQVRAGVTAEDKGVCDEILNDLQHNWGKVSIKKMKLMVGEARYLVNTY